MIYLCTSLPDDVPAEMLRLLPQERTERMKRYKKNSDRVLCAVSYCLFRYSMKTEYNISFPSVWKTKKFGKPYFPNDEGIEFNISHCSEGAVCITDRGQCGVDIQNISEITLNIADMVCSDEELGEIRLSGSPERKLCCFWALKEAYGKYTGEGLCGNVKEYDFSGIISCNFERYGCCFSVFDMGNFFIAACAERFFSSSDLIKLDSGDLIPCF